MRFLAAFIALVAIFALAYGGLAYLVNPRGDFPTAVFPDLISDAMQEKMHLFKTYQTGGRIDGLLLGSSRSMKLAPRAFERALGGRYFNFAVNNAHAEDLLLIYRWVRQQGVHPRRVIIGLDVEALHYDQITNLTDEQLATLVGPIARSPRPPLWRQGMVAAEKINTTFTLSYLNDMMRSVRIKVAPGPTDIKQQAFDVDGYQHYPRYEAQRRAGTFHLDQEIEAGQKFYVDRFRGMKALSGIRMGQLEQIISEAQRDGGQVTIWITPIHPQIVAHLNRATPYPQRLRETRDYIRRLHAQYGVQVFDCSEPPRFGGTDTDWYDGAHMDENNANRVVDVLLGRKQELQLP